MSSLYRSWTLDHQVTININELGFIVKWHPDLSTKLLINCSNKTVFSEQHKTSDSPSIKSQLFPPLPKRYEVIRTVCSQCSSVCRNKICKGSNHCTKAKHEKGVQRRGLDVTVEWLQLLLPVTEIPRSIVAPDTSYHHSFTSSVPTSHRQIPELDLRSGLNWFFPYNSQLIIHNYSPIRHCIMYVIEYSSLNKLSKTPYTTWHHKRLEFQ